MGKGVNKVIIVGNVGTDPEVRYMPNGGAVANISVATSESWKDKNTGEQKEETEWHRCVFYNRLAEIVGEYVRKGSKVYLEGKLKTRSWEQDGVKRYSTEVICSEMQMLDSRGDNQQQPAQQQQKAQNHSSSRQQQAPSQRSDNHQSVQNQRSQQHQQGQQQQGQVFPQQSYPQQGQQQQQYQPKNPMPATAAVDDFDDDIPF